MSYSLCEDEVLHEFASLLRNNVARLTLFVYFRQIQDETQA